MMEELTRRLEKLKNEFDSGNMADFSGGEAGRATQDPVAHQRRDPGT